MGVRLVKAEKRDSDMWDYESCRSLYEENAGHPRLLWQMLQIVVVNIILRL